MTPAFAKLKPYLEKARRLHYLVSLLNYDMATCCPEKSLEEIASLLTEYDTELASISKDPEFIVLVKSLQNEPSLSDMERRLVDRELETIEYMEKLTPEEYGAMRQAYTKSNEMWRLYKGKSDFASWLPYWEKCVEAKKKELRLKQKEGESLYDVCLRTYEPGSSEAAIDAVFEPLKKYLIAKIPEALKAQEAMPKPYLPSFPKYKQEALSYAVLRTIGYDITRGALRESEHPFSDNLSINDARITTHYDEFDYRSSLFSVIHEGGHAIEFQGWPKEQYDEYVDGYSTAAICETHSRFYENLLARSRDFIPTLRKLLTENLSPEFSSLSDDEIYAISNSVKPIPNRCDSDELTYSLHIIIRYEVEKELINGRIECKDVPALWNKKYKEYLGVDVPNDKEGCMQDIHWTDGEFGYFPSYALGNIYGAMILNEMKKTVDVSACLTSGHLEPIKAWLAKNDFPYTYLTPDKWILKVTGRSMDAQDFIDYLNSKY
ncbi:MAG: carboxypeptidase M32 [Candidatus Enteromonas sp.]|nr:carboxypeptidase M32 [Candidatus Enteromonas sp.]